MTSLYRLSATGVVRTCDGACIPNDPVNRDWVEYLNSGVVPDPYVPPAAQPLSSLVETITLRVLFNHENRIRVLEGKAPITQAQFLAALQTMLGG